MQFNFRRNYETDLIRRLKSGEQQAWAEYTREYGMRVYQYLRAHLPDPESTEDILNETMGAAVKAIQKFEGSSSLSAFTLALAQRKVADFWRKRQTTQSLEEHNLSTLPAVNTQEEERLEFLEALSRIPQSSQEALLLRYQVGLSIDEIAKTMERSYKGIESLLSRARQQLHESLDDVLDSSLPQIGEVQLLLHSVLHQLNTQMQHCLANDRSEEAAIFSHYREMVSAMVREEERYASPEIRTNRATIQAPPIP